MKTFSCARPLVAGAPLLFALLLASSASAQSIRIADETNLPRLDRNGLQITKRSAYQNPEGINRADCDDEQQIKVTLQMMDLAPNGALQAWAALSGADCKMQQNRSGSTRVCWPLVTGIPIMNVVVQPIPVRKILSGAAPSSGGVSDDSSAACGAIDRTRLSVHFLYFAPGDLATAVVDKVIDVDADTIGPPPAVNLTAVAASDGVEVSWANAATPVFVRTNVFCAKVDASGACSAALRQGSVPSLSGDSLCAQLDGDAPSSILIRGRDGLNPLARGTSYAFAVSHVDAFMNPGPLSNVACAEPGPPSSSDGGCSTHGSRAPNGVAAGLLSAAAVGAFVWSRRRRRRAFGELVQ